MIKINYGEQRATFFFFASFENAEEFVEVVKGAVNSSCVAKHHERELLSYRCDSCIARYE